MLRRVSASTYKGGTFRVASPPNLRTTCTRKYDPFITLHITHYTLHSTHYTLHITRYTLHTAHYTLHVTV